MRSLNLKRSFVATTRRLPLSADEEDVPQFWQEEDFVFEGTPCTKYIWPKDRPIVFDDNDGTVSAPLFSYGLRVGGIEDNMRLAIRAMGPGHCHVVFVRGCHDMVAIITAHAKMIPTMDHFKRDRNRARWMGA